MFRWIGLVKVIVGVVALLFLIGGVGLIYFRSRGVTVYNETGQVIEYGVSGTNSSTDDGVINQNVAGVLILSDCAWSGGRRTDTCGLCPARTECDVGLHSAKVAANSALCFAPPNLSLCLLIAPVSPYPSTAWRAQAVRGT